VERGETLIVGLGEVGSALAEILERHRPVLRHDLEPVQFDCPIGVMHICIPCQSPESFEQAVCGYIERFRPALTIINSTVAPGTTAAIARRAAAPLAYSPVRGKHVRMAEDLLRYVKYVAGVDAETAASAQRHFEEAGMKTRRMSRPEALELAKLAETTYFGVLIAFAQELNRYAGAVGAKYDEVSTFFEEVEFLPRVCYFPGFIGGHCVIPNIHLLRKVRGSPLLDAVLESNSMRAAESVQETAPGGDQQPARKDAQKNEGDVLAHR
jgi:UDP-glucose 6-dehydrogenase